MKYELELNTDKQSLKRIQDLIQNLHNILTIQYNDSMKGIGGGASLFYKVNIDIKEEWL